MKKQATYILFIIPFLLFSPYSFAQTDVWNLDFETWNEDVGTTPIQDTIIENRVGLFPPHWHYRSTHIPEGTGLGRTTDATNGEYAVTLSGFYQYEVMRIISGESDQKSGWPIDFKPTRLIGDYKVILLGSRIDSLRGYVSVFLSKYDQTNQVRDTIGEGHLVLKETLNDYETFDIPIDYLNQASQPDTVIIVLAKERFGFDSPSVCMECSHVYFDNLHLSTFPTSTEEIELPKLVEIYPNPASGLFQLSFIAHKDTHTLKIMNSQGQLIQQYKNLSSEVTIDVKSWNRGIYFLITENKSTGFIQTQKFIVE